MPDVVSRVNGLVDSFGPYSKNWLEIIVPIETASVRCTVRVRITTRKTLSPTCVEVSHISLPVSYGCAYQLSHQNQTAQKLGGGLRDPSRRLASLAAAARRVQVCSGRKVATPHQSDFNDAVGTS